jgi:hypothetical protein
VNGLADSWIAAKGGSSSMNVFVILIIVVLVVVVALVALKAKGASQTSQTGAKLVADLYYLRKSLFSPAERSFVGVLENLDLGAP